MDRLKIKSRQKKRTKRIKNTRQKPMDENQRSKKQKKNGE